MSDVIISCKGLGKKYSIGAKESYYSLRESLSKAWRNLDNHSQTFWALKNFDLDVDRGETLGIIGQNGAGKSTLLKILSRITPPTTGTVTMKGKVVSLLEVGTGFHQELTGRENIFLNGAILGMNKKEINEKFEKIVDFSEIGKFIDTPVKRYSSGMFVRLAFSVAAHLESEILLVDEVLAVGDIGFQNKCLGKMDEVAKSGRTVILVSHNMGAIVSLCRSAIWIENGQIKMAGKSAQVTKAYIGNTITHNVTDLSIHPNRDKKFTRPIITFFSIHNSDKPIEYNGKLTMTIGYDIPESLANPEFAIIVKSPEGFRVFTLTNMRQSSNLPYVLRGKGKIHCIVDHINLLPGMYNISLRLWTVSQKLDDIENVASFKIISSNSKRLDPALWNSDLGVTYVDAKWTLKK